MNGFRFGLEAEFCLAQKSTLRPLWYKELSFKELDTLFASLSLDGIPSLEGLAAEPPHQKLMPWIVEGYGIPDADFKVIDALPKGVEIRTPVCESIEQTLEVYATLYQRMKTGLATLDLIPLALSHHPTESKFTGPQNKRRHDFWQWAMEVMTTYGPDINVSFPTEITKRLFANLDDLNAKVDYYAPAMAAVSLNSPLLNGRPWEVKGERGLSYRTFRRSTIAPAIELHEDENFRIEFKVFEMSPDARDFEAYFLLTTALFLDEGLKGRASKYERIYDLGQVARHGIGAEGMRGRLAATLTRAPAILTQHGFNPQGLERLNERLESRRTPAHELRERFDQVGGNLVETLRPLSTLRTLSGQTL
mgnify:CR=1 FL=1